MFKAFRKKPRSDSATDGMTPDISRVLPGHETGAARIVPKAASEDAGPAVESEPGAASTLVLGEDSVVTPENEPEAEAPDTETETDATSDTAWLDEDLATLRGAAEVFLEDPTSETDRRALFLVAHNMRGAAGAYDLPVIERITGSLCLLLEQDNDPAGASALINLHVEACRAAANHKSARSSADLADAVCTALEDQVSARLSGWG